MIRHALKTLPTCHLQRLSPRRLRRWWRCSARIRRGGAGAGIRAGDRACEHDGRAASYVGEQQRYPDLIRTSLETVRDRLGDARLHRGAARRRCASGAPSFEEAQGTMERARRSRAWFESASEHAAFAQPDAAQQCGARAINGRADAAALDAADALRGVPYQDNEASGTAFNDGGRALSGDVNAAIRARAPARCRPSTPNSPPSAPSCRRATPTRRRSCAS